MHGQILTGSKTLQESLGGGACALIQVGQHQHVGFAQSAGGEQPLCAQSFAFGLPEQSDQFCAARGKFSTGHRPGGPGPARPLPKGFGRLGWGANAVPHQDDRFQQHGMIWGRPVEGRCWLDRPGLGRGRCVCFRGNQDEYGDKQNDAAKLHGHFPSVEEYGPSGVSTLHLVEALCVRGVCSALGRCSTRLAAPAYSSGLDISRPILKIFFRDPQSGMAVHLEGLVCVESLGRTPVFPGWSWPVRSESAKAAVAEILPMAAAA